MPLGNGLGEAQRLPPITGLGSDCFDNDSMWSRPWREPREDSVPSGAPSELDEPLRSGSMGPHPIVMELGGLQPPGGEF